MTSTEHPHPLDGLLQDVHRQFEQQLRIEELLGLSEKLQTELRQHMISSPQCMLPSFNYELPNGQEQGIYLALEVGGSNLRVALVAIGERPQSIRTHHNRCFSIDTAIRQLTSFELFDWMAQRVRELLGEGAELLGHRKSTGPLPMGVAWSFPLESVQTMEYTLQT